MTKSSSGAAAYFKETKIFFISLTYFFFPTIIHSCIVVYICNLLYSGQLQEIVSNQKAFRRLWDSPCEIIGWQRVIPSCEKY